MKDQTVVAEDSYGNGNNNDNNSLGEEGGARYKTLGKVVIPVVNRMQDIFTHLGSASMIDLPHMAVVGSQSNGKSSVLEALIGCDFLPSGSNIYTPRPLVLQLVQSVHQSEEATEWGEFLHLPGKCFTDFSSICKEIQVYEKKL